MRNMSFSHTCDQFTDRSKDVTRRLGWEFLKPGELLCAVRKSRGLKKGEKVQRLGTIRVISTRREPLHWISYTDVGREGYPLWTGKQFVDHFCRAFRCTPETMVTRIQFEIVSLVKRRRPAKKRSLTHAV